MQKRGVKPKGNIVIKWSADFAYAIGLITTDGNLSTDGRHIIFTSKDRELAEIYKKCLKLKNIIGKKGRGVGTPKKYFVVQFGDVLFYEFLESVGLMRCKSKTLKRIDVPPKYFYDFLRGCYDGDGYSHSYLDPRWKSSFMFYLGLASASENFLDWIRSELFRRLKVKGHITSSKGSSCMQLKYAKKEGKKILEKIYYAPDVVCLGRKKLKNETILAIVAEKEKYARVL